MKKNLATVLQAFITTAVIAISLTFAQGNSSTTNGLGFFGDMSVKIYCTFSNFIPGSDNSACKTNVFVTDNNNVVGQISGEATTTVHVSNTPFNYGGGTKIIYQAGRDGKDGKNGTTTIVYQSAIPGAGSIGPSAYIFAGGNGFVSNPYQTTVPGDVWQSFIHQFSFENAKGNNLSAVNIMASTTDTDNLTFRNATGGNIVATGTVTTLNLLATDSTITNASSTNLYSLFSNLINLLSTNATITNATSTNLYSDFASITEATTSTLFANNASITNATTTYLFSAWANFLNLFVDSLIFNNATGTNLQVANASTTNFSATGTSFISELYLASSTQTNSSINSGNATLTSAVVNNATNTNMYSNFASITEATTTNLFAAIFNALNAKIDSLVFNNATGTNLQVANASTTNFTATGTTQLTGNTYVASTTIAQANIQSGNATLTNSVATNGTTTNLFSTKASLTNATTTNLFTVLFNALSATITNLIATNATVTNATTTNIFATNAKLLTASSTFFVSTNATLTNATVTNLKVTNCAEGNIACDGGNYTKPFQIGQDRPLILGTLNDGNVEIVTGNDIYTNPVATSAKLIIEDGNYQAGDVEVVNTLKVGKNIIASGTATVTNLYATGTFALATGTIASTSISWLNILKGLFVNNATITNATTTNIFATNASITDATSTNLFSASAKFLNLLVDKFTANVVNVGVLNATTSVNALSLFASTTNASTTNFVNALGNFATITNSTSTNISTTNLFAKIFNFINATGTDLKATGTANLVNIISASSSLTNANILSGNAIFTNLFGTKATVTNATVTADLAVGGLLNVNNGILYVDNVANKVAINTTTLAGGSVRLTIAGDARVGTTGTNGCIQRFDGTALSGTCVSDENLKTNIVDLDTGSILNKLMNIRFVTYSWNDVAHRVYGNSTDSKVVGVTAQNVEAQFPELIQTDEYGYKRVNLTDLQWYILSAVKEVNARVDSVNSKIANTTDLILNSLTAKKVATDQLCIGETCITEQDLKDFKAYKAQIDAIKNSNSAIIPDPVVVPPATLTEPVATPTEPIVPVVETPATPTEPVTQ